MSTRRRVLLSLLAVLVVAGGLIGSRFTADLRDARARATRGAQILQTRCGPIEVQQAGQGAPLLMVHGAGGGHDQGMAFARRFADEGMRVIAVSRFGYLGTPMPANASPAAQADAHACVLDALGIDRAAVMGVSAGALSATQLAVRHPARVGALALVVPLAYTPAVATRFSGPPSRADRLLQWMVGSDFVFWSASHLAREQVIERVLGTPAEVVATASAADQAIVQQMLDDILPISARAAGLRNEAWQATHLQPVALERIRAPTLVISARDEGYGTYANAQYLVAHIAGARLLGYPRGGHLLVGHGAEVHQALREHMRMAR